MSDLDEPRVRCPSCGKLVPAMKYCIYCGAKLPQASPPVMKPPQRIPPPSLPPVTPPPVQPPKRAAPPPYAMGVKDEIVNLMSGITALYMRKISLLELLQSEQVSERVFLKLYKEYSGKLKDFLNARAAKTEELRKKLEETNKRLSEISMNLEELEVRHKVGEVDSNVYTQRTEKLKADERELIEQAKILRANINSLENLLGDKRPSEIRDLETNLRTYQSTLEKMVKQGKITEETFKAVRPDIEKMFLTLGSLIKSLKEKDRNLREQLETLQTRYKLSELSIEEYERRKKEIQTEIDKLWA